MSEDDAKPPTETVSGKKLDRRRLDADGRRAAPPPPSADPDATAPESHEAGKDTAANFATVAGMALALTAVLGPGIYELVALREERMVIVSAATMQRDTTWRLSGRVLMDGAPLRARVWAIATDDQGNRFAPPAVVSDSQGAYVFAPIPARIAPAADSIARRIVAATDTTPRVTSEVTVFARQITADSLQVATISETVRLSSSARTRWVRLPPAALLTVVFIFVLSIVAGIAQGKPGGLVRKLQYYGNVMLAFLMTGTVVALISLGLRHVNLTGTQGDVIALGFANIYKGTYVKDVAPEWLFSLTAPWQGTGADTLARGFGVPLWALLLSCFGAGVFTIRLVVKQIRTPVRLTDDRQFRTRLQELVRHQFYILFAPVAAVFVYQLLVAGGAASEPITVGFVMLAAGLVLNNVLDRAMVAARGALESNDPIGANGRVGDDSVESEREDAGSHGAPGRT